MVCVHRWLSVAMILNCDIYSGFKHSRTHHNKCTGPNNDSNKAYDIKRKATVIISQ